MKTKITPFKLRPEDLNRLEFIRKRLEEASGQKQTRADALRFAVARAYSSLQQITAQR